MKLFAEIIDEDLLFKLIHELGCTFYRRIGNGEYEILYKSNERTVHYKGKIDNKNVNILEGLGWKVSKIDFDEMDGTVKIIQE